MSCNGLCTLIDQGLALTSSEKLSAAETNKYRNQQLDMVVRKGNLNLKELFPSQFFLQATENSMEDDIQYIKARLDGGHQRKKAFYINRIETRRYHRT